MSRAPTRRTRICLATTSASGSSGIREILVTRSRPLGLWQNNQRDAQKDHPARLQRAKRHGGTYRTSCGPLALALDLGERKSPSSVSDPLESSTRVESSERCENDAGGLFQHPARLGHGRHRKDNVGGTTLAGTFDLVVTREKLGVNRGASCPSIEPREADELG